MKWWFLTKKEDEEYVFPFDPNNISYLIFSKSLKKAFIQPLNNASDPNKPIIFVPKRHQEKFFAWILKNNVRHEIGS